MSRPWPRVRRPNGRGRGLFVAGGGSFTPADLTGLRLWLTAGPSWCFTNAAGTTPCGDGDPIRVWKDRSGNAFDLSQSSSSLRPTLFDTGGGVWKATFDGVDDYIALASYTQADTAGFSLVAKAALSADGFFPVLFGTTDTVHETRFDNSTRKWSTVVNSGGSTVTDSTARTVGVVYRLAAIHDFVADTAELFVNNVSVASGGDTTSSPALNLAVGARSSGSIPFPGDVYELVYLERPLTSGERSSLDAYLS